ncbi:hypothetical protein LTR08_002656 [Meristemomyces frigidus]|nr:hypothetical protein LTR08_002656 [Meristemomyces frigidus]
MDSSPFFRLPAEIRTSIYELALTDPSPVKVCLSRTGCRLNTTVNVLGLTSSCQQISKECAGLFLANNEFVVTAGDYSNHINPKHAHHTLIEEALSPLNAFIDAVGTDNAAALKHVTLDIGTRYIRRIRVKAEQQISSAVLATLRSLALENPKWELTFRLTFVISSLLMDSCFTVAVELNHPDRLLQEAVDAVDAELLQVEEGYQLYTRQLKTVTEFLRQWQEVVKDDRDV